MSDPASSIMIWKFALPTSRSVLNMPKGAKILSVGRQGSEIVLWAEVFSAGPSGPREPRIINAFNTGVQLPPDRIAFIGTVQIPAGPPELAQEIVWHVYEVGS